MTELPDWYLQQTDLSEMLQEQAEWYQGKTDLCETAISFCLVHSEHGKTSKVEIFAKIVNSSFYKRLHLRCFYRVLNTPLLWKE